MSRGEDNMMRKDQRGFTIVELLIAIAILSIVVAAVCSFILVGSRSYASANSDISVQQEAQLAMNQMSDVLIDTTRSVNYVGYDSSDRSVLALKDSEFGFEPVAKSLIMYNGVPVQKDSAISGADPDITIEPGNGNKHYHFYWDKDEETLYYAELDVKDTDKKPEDVDFGNPADSSDPASPTWWVLAEHVTKFEVDLTQVEEKRVVQLELTFENGKREYNTSNNVTIRNRVAVNDAEVGPLNRKKTLSIAVRDKGVIVEPGESYHFSTPKVTGENVTDKSVTWSIVSTNSPSGGTQFTDAANGILKIAPDEPAGTIQVMVTTNAVDSDGNHASTPPIDVYIKRVTTLGLYKSADTNDENGPNEISPGCTFTISTNVGGHKLGVTCSACGESTEKDRQVSCEGNRDNSNFPWRIVDPQEYDPSMSWWKPKDYLKLISQDEHSATFYLEPNTPDDGSFKFVIQAMSLLSVCPNEQGRCEYFFGEAIELTSVKGKENAEPISGMLKYGEETLIKEIVGDLSTEGHEYVTCVRVVDNTGKSPDKILLYFTIGHGADYRIVPDMFDLDLNGSYTFYMQAMDPVSKENHKLGNHHQADSHSEIWNEYINHLSKTKPYGYVGDKYDYNKVYYSVLDKPRAIWDYKGVRYKGKDIVYDPVNIYTINQDGIIIGNVEPSDYENIWHVNRTQSKMTYSVYEGKGDRSQWTPLYWFDEKTMSYKGSTSVGDGVGRLMIQDKPGRPSNPSSFFVLGQGDKLKVCGNYHIVSGFCYNNTYDNFNTDAYEFIGWQGFSCDGQGQFVLPHNDKYYEFDDSIIHVDVNSEFTMDINDDQFKGKAMFPLPSQMAGDTLFPNLSSIDWQNSAGELKVAAMKEGNSHTEELRFDYVRYHYISKNNTYEVEPIQIRKSGNKLVIHSFGIYVCEENGTKWHFTKSVADKDLNFNVKQFEYNGGQYQTYFPLPTEEGFPFVNGIEQTLYGLSLYDNNLENKGNLSGVTVTCKQTGNDYEIMFVRKVKDQNQNNHKIRVVSYGTYTWSIGQTEWQKKAGTEELPPETDFVPSLEGLQLGGKTYKMYLPAPTEGSFPFKGTGSVLDVSSMVLYLENDQYAESGINIYNFKVKYELTGGTHQVTFYREEWDGIKTDGIFQWDGQSSWIKK